MDYRLIVTVNSDKDHPPVTLAVKVPEQLANLLMATPVKSISLAVEAKPGYISKLTLLDFK